MTMLGAWACRRRGGFGVFFCVGLACELIPLPALKRGQDSGHVHVNATRRADAFWGLPVMLRVAALGPDPTSYGFVYGCWLVAANSDALYVWLAYVAVSATAVPVVGCLLQPFPSSTATGSRPPCHRLLPPLAHLSAPYHALPPRRHLQPTFHRLYYEDDLHRSGCCCLLGRHSLCPRPACGNDRGCHTTVPVHDRHHRGEDAPEACSDSGQLLQCIYK
ncbi:hypothetical protein Taro_052004 [Colocasia esculenta]|uniref:Uncharacterized protein n=1 Tax=Colocasia esculenta TaxID=4460 RepID=A0A843XI34_COLES|nr:hypothetical protein [Colocasia esculenta]